MATRQRPIGDRAQRVQIAPTVERTPVQALGRHQGRRAHDLGRAPKRSKRTEIDELGAPVRGEAHVRGAHVAMNQTARMQEREGRRYVAQVGAEFANGQLGRRGEIPAAQQLHRVVRPLGVDPVVVHLDDRRVPEPRQGGVLALEQRRQLGTRTRRADPEALVGDRLPRQLIGRAEDGSHAAPSELFVDDIALPGAQVRRRKRLVADSHEGILSRSRAAETGVSERPHRTRGMLTAPHL